MLYLDNSGSMSSVLDIVKKSVMELGQDCLFKENENDNPF